MGTLAAPRASHPVPAAGAEIVGEELRRKWLPAITCILGLIGTVVLTFITPPLQVPDENRHFYRAYQISEGRVFSKVRDGMVGDALPSSLHEMDLAMLNERRSTSQPLPLRRSHAASTRELHRPLDPAQRTFTEFRGSAFYSPLAYIPQAAVIALGRAVKLSPLALLYAARLANAVAVILLLTWSMSILPYGQEALMFLGLLPMAMFEYASVSADALVIGAAIAFLAIAFRARARERWTKLDIAAASVLGAVFCSVKPVYAPMLLAALLPLRWQRPKFMASLRAHAVICFVALGFTAAWLAASSSSMVVNNYPSNVAVDPRMQMLYIAVHPIFFAEAVTSSFRYFYADYFTQAVGLLGWLTVLLPGWVYLLPALWLLVLAFPRLKLPHDRCAAWSLAMAAASAVLVMMALYIMWSPVGSALIFGVQGRYFLPALILAGIAISPKPTSDSMVRFRYCTFAALVAVNIGATIWTVATRFWPM